MKRVLVVLEVFVTPTDNTFDVDLYLVANPDVRSHGVDPRKHFKERGVIEERKQINPLLFSVNGYRKSKFERFQHALMLGDDRAAKTFPLRIGDTPLTLADYASESANNDFPAFVEAVASNPEKLFLDLGCGLRRRLFDNCLYLEVYPSITADLIVPPTCEYPIKDAMLDGIGCFSVLEHTRKPWLVVQEMRRMLKPGGKVWIDWPFLQPLHGYPSHFFNATREGVRSVFEDSGFIVNELGTGDHEAPDNTISWVLGGFIRALPEWERERLLEMRVGDLLARAPRTPFWQHLLSRVDDNVRSTFSCGNYLVAQLPIGDIPDGAG